MSTAKDGLPKVYTVNRLWLQSPFCSNFTSMKYLGRKIHLGTCSILQHPGMYLSLLHDHVAFIFDEKFCLQLQCSSN